MTFKSLNKDNAERDKRSKKDISGFERVINYILTLTQSCPMDGDYHKQQ